jgi:hypothetical protein
LATHPFSRIDHFFVSSDIEVTSIEVPATELDRIASDHLPLIVDLKVDLNIGSEKAAKIDFERVERGLRRVHP